MEVLSPSYIYLSELIMALESGVGARNFTQQYMHDSSDTWCEMLAKIVFRVSEDDKVRTNLLLMNNPYERALLYLLERSFDGEPVLEELRSLESQYFKAHQKILDKHLLKLPYLSLIPLFLFLFPSYLLLMLGPILLSLLKELS